MTWAPTPADSPYARVGGREPTVALAEAFYDVMEESEPALAKLHPLDEHGKITRGARDRFALFLVGWLGGPQDYMEKHGHPRLRMRHGRVPVSEPMRDAWIRCMHTAMIQRNLDPEVRVYLEARFAEVATFLRNA
ncbi:group II truncated hemoglobin [soil metagenome]